MLKDIFGNSALALKLAEARSEILSENITNANTPNYKARDIDFRSILQNHGEQLALSSEKQNPLSSQDGDTRGMDLLYRVPFQKSLDGNTVDAEMERKNFMENALRYQVGITFIENKTKQLLEAIKGEVL